MNGVTAACLPVGCGDREREKRQRDGASEGAGGVQENDG